MIWRKVKGFEESYQVNENGGVRSIDRVGIDKNGVKYTVKGRILKPRVNTKGYYQVNLSVNGFRKTMEIHKLVANSFLNTEDSSLVVDHIDNDRLNNKASNLQMIAHRLNTSKDRKNKTSKYIGVSMSKGENKWRTSIYINKSRFIIGSFSCEEEANKAYQKALSIAHEFVCKESFRELLRNKNSSC